MNCLWLALYPAARKTSAFICIFLSTSRCEATSQATLWESFLYGGWRGISCHFLKFLPAAYQHCSGLIWVELQPAGANPGSYFRGAEWRRWPCHFSACDLGCRSWGPSAWFSRLVPLVSSLPPTVLLPHKADSGVYFDVKLDVTFPVLTQRHRGVFTWVNLLPRGSALTILNLSEEVFWIGI